MLTAVKLTIDDVQQKVSVNCIAEFILLVSGKFATPINSIEIHSGIAISPTIKSLIDKDTMK